MTVGVLALQGNYEKHLEKLESLDCPAVLIKYPNQLSQVDGLVLPGGESTCMTLLMEKTGFHTAVSKFAKEKPIFGTCAGLVLMASESNDSRIASLNLIDVTVDRNGYGRQVHSGIHPVELKLNGHTISESSMFIRAPKITRIGGNVEIIGKMGMDPVAVRQDHHLASCFHPEMSQDSNIYSLFLEMIHSHCLANAV